MNLQDIGLNDQIITYRKSNNLTDFALGRIISEHKERYKVRTETGEIETEITGNLRFSAQSRADFPAVGDWVNLIIYEENFALIHSIIPRSTVITRKAVGQASEVQIIASNIDSALIIQSVNRDFNINRLERYLSICHTAKVNPIIVLSKIDLIPPHELEKLLNSVRQRIHGIPLIALSNMDKNGMVELKQIIKKGKTYCMLGSSGVGKSTLANLLSGKNIMETGAISKSIDRGKHISSHRELIVIENGAILIDNPGMREVGITDSSSGLEITFNLMADLGNACKFNNCNHINENGCAILAALEEGEIDEDSYQNYLRMLRESLHFESTVAEKRKKDKKFGKMVKQIMKEKNKSKGRKS